MSKLHKTYGIYPDMSWKCNAVLDEDLAYHVEYNKTYRPGRTLIVDGVIEYCGSLSKEVIEEFVRKTLSKFDESWDPKHSTAPYH